jgi:signal transduction histidine kinase
MKIRLLFISFLFSLPLFGQNLKSKNIDSLLIALKSQKEDSSISKICNLISDHYLYLDSDKGIFYAKKALQISQKNNWKTEAGVSYKNIGMHLISKGNYDDALSNLIKAESIFKASSDGFNLGLVYNEMGILRGNQSRFPESLEYFFKSLHLFENVKNRNANAQIGSAYENIGTIYNFTNNYEDAIVNFQKAIKILRAVKNKEVRVAANIASLGNIYQKQNKIPEAIIEYKKAEEILKNKNDDFASASVESWLGSAYLIQKKYNLSIEKLTSALSKVSKSKDKDLTAATLQNLGYAEFQKGISLKNSTMINDGFLNLQKSLALYQELGNQDGLKRGYQYLSEYFSYQKNFEESLENYKLFSIYNDSIFNTQNKQSLQNLEDQRTIELSSKEIQLQKLTLESKEKQKWYYIIGIGLLFSIGGLLYFQSRNRKLVNKKLHILNHDLDVANKTKARFFSILNHDLRSPVANLIHFLHLQKEDPELLDPETKIRLENKTILTAENLLSSMEDILLWSKGQMQNFQPSPKKVSVSELFEDIERHFSSCENIQIKFEDPINLILMTDQDYLKTILRNLTGNAVKVLEKIKDPIIIWEAYTENNFIFLSIIDNGKGATIKQFRALYDESEVVGIKSGLGLHLIRDLAKAINCEVKVETNDGNSTKIILKFKKDL